MPVTRDDLAELLKQFRDFSAKNNEELLGKLTRDFQLKLAELETRLRAEFMEKIAELEARHSAAKIAAAPTPLSVERGHKSRKTEHSSFQAASANGRVQRKQVVLLGFPEELAVTAAARTGTCRRYSEAICGLQRFRTNNQDL